VKKLAIAALLVGAACRRQVVVASPPASSTTASATTAVGGATARDAVQRFLASAKAQDLQAMSNIWGTATGPVAGTMPQSQLEQREIYMIRCLKHDSYRVVDELPATGGERMFTVELKYQDLTRSTNFYATPGPRARWYIRSFDPNDLQDICTRR